MQTRQVGQVLRAIDLDQRSGFPRRDRVCDASPERSPINEDVRDLSRRTHMNSYLSSEQTPHRSASTTSAHGEDDVVRNDVLAETLSQLSRDVASLKDTFSLLV